MTKGREKGKKRQEESKLFLDNGKINQRELLLQREKREMQNLSRLNNGSGSRQQRWQQQ